MDTSCEENPDQVSTTTEDQQGPGPTQARSYECTFCKRGFSNAQALGGHMNIHRKDRAKLRQPSIHKKPTLDTTKRSLSYPSMPSHENKSEVLECTLKWPWIVPRDTNVVGTSENCVGELRQLELFVESPSSIGWHEEKGMMKTAPSHGSSATDLDLELRLGPDPLEKTSASGIIEFF